jgi:hypothetical protein
LFFGGSTLPPAGLLTVLWSAALGAHSGEATDCCGATGEDSGECAVEKG